MKKGYSFVEIMIATALIGTILIPIFNLFFDAARVTNNSSKVRVANQLCTEITEYFKFLPYSTKDDKDLDFKSGFLDQNKDVFFIGEDGKPDDSKGEKDFNKITSDSINPFTTRKFTKSYYGLEWKVKIVVNRTSKPKSIKIAAMRNFIDFKFATITVTVKYKINDKEKFKTMVGVITPQKMM